MCFKCPKRIPTNTFITLLHISLFCPSEVLLKFESKGYIQEHYQFLISHLIHRNPKYQIKKLIKDTIPITMSFCTESDSKIA